MARRVVITGIGLICAVALGWGTAIASSPGVDLPSGDSGIPMDVAFSKLMPPWYSSVYSILALLVLIGGGYVVFCLVRQSTRDHMRVQLPVSDAAGLWMSVSGEAAWSAAVDGELPE